MTREGTLWGMSEGKQIVRVGEAIEMARKRISPPMSARRAAEIAGISEGRWRQIVKGYQAIGDGHRAPVEGPANTVARMARAVGLAPVDLELALRPDAAEELRNLSDDDLIAREVQEREQRKRSQLEARRNDIVHSHDREEDKLNDQIRRVQELAISLVDEQDAESLREQSQRLMARLVRLRHMRMVAQLEVARLEGEEAVVNGELDRIMRQQANVRAADFALAADDPDPDEPDADDPEDDHP